MVINCIPLVEELFLFYCESDFMMSLPDDTHADTIEAFKSISRYLCDLFNIGNPDVEGVVTLIYPTELH